MILFLRKIREKLISENKIGRYLKYALGEIILVVIGILIALSINNWNQQRMVKQEAVNYYKNIKRQLLEDTEIIKSNIDFNSYYNEQYRYAIELIEADDRTQIDSLAKISINLLEYSDFHQESNAYEALVNSGEIKILNNQEIIQGLQRLGEIYIYINKLEVGHFEIIKAIYPDLQKIVALNSKKIEKIDLLFTFEFQNQFVISLEITKEKDEIYHRALDEIKSILNLIDTELDGSSNPKR